MGVAFWWQRERRLTVLREHCPHVGFNRRSGLEAVGISVWDNKENADAYNRASYPEVQRLLSKVIEGTPEVRTYEVSVSTFPKAAALGVKA